MNNLSLYNITSAFPMIMEQEEMTPGLKEELERELTVLLQEKSQNIIGYVRNMELAVDAMKTEEKRISEQRKGLENKIEKFKNYVKECMERNGFSKIDTGLGSLAIAKNPMSVEIENEDEIPGEFKQEIVTTKIDKTAIKKYFKETGEIIPGAIIVDDKTSLRIK